MPTNEVNWKAHSHKRQDKNQDWFWVLRIISGSIAISSALLGNYLFSVLVVIAGFTISKLAQKRPELVNFTLSDSGLKVGITNYSIDSIKKFWIDSTNSNNPILLLETTSVLMPHLSIPIQKFQAEKIRSILKRFAKEEELHEPAVNKILESLGF